MAELAGPEDYPDLMEDIQSTLQTVARLQRERIALVGRASTRRGRITAVVNADNVLVDLKFNQNVDDLSHAELSRAIVEATQAAAADLARKSKELMQPLQEQRARLPKISDLVPGMPDLREGMPVPQPPPLTKPATDRDAAGEDSALTYDNVEVVDERNSHEPGVTDSSW